MKRDLDLVRSILLRLEDSDEIRASRSTINDLADDKIINAHLLMLEDAGFLVQHSLQPLSQGVRLNLGWRITWEGHEFLDTVRDPEIWRKTKTGAEKVGGWTIKLLADVAAGYVRLRAQELGLPV